MTNQNDIKKLAQQMAGSMKSFDDIKDFQKQLINPLLIPLLKLRWKIISAIPNMKRRISLTSATGTLKRESVATSPPQETVIAALSLYSLVSIKPVSQVLTTRSSLFMLRVRPPLRLSKPSKTSTTSTSQAAWFQESLITS